MSNVVNKYYYKYTILSDKVKAAVWYTICNFFQKGISVLVVPIYTRLLTTEQYGSYMIWLAWLEIFEIIATFRLSWGGYTAGLVKFEQDRDRYTSAMQSLGFCITTSCLLIYLAFSDFINSLTGMTTAMTLIIFGILYTMPAMSFWTARQRVEYKYKNAVVITLISSIFIPLIGIWLISFFEQKDLALINGRFIVQGILGLYLLYVNCRNDFTFFHKEYWIRALSFNGSLIPYYLSLVVLHSSNRIIIERLIDKSAAAIFSVAFSASMVMLLVNSALNSTLQPWLFNKIKNKDKQGIIVISTATIGLVAAINLLLTAFAPEAVRLLAPPAYYEAIYIIPPITASVVVMFCYQYFVNVEFYFEKGKFISFASIVAAVINIGLNIYLIPIYGYYAAGYVTLLCYVLFGIAHYFFMKYVLTQMEIDIEVVNIRNIAIIFLFYGVFATITALLYDCWLMRYVIISTIVICMVLMRRNIVDLYSTIKKK